jgi:hypothetical protein
MPNFEVREIETVNDLPQQHSRYQVSNPDNRSELSHMEGGDTIVVVYSTENGERAYLYDHIQFNGQYLNSMQDDNIVIVYKIQTYP